MKTIYLNAAFISILLIAGTGFVAAQDTTAWRIHEVGLGFYRFNIEDFSLIYKVQSKGMENKYARYRLVFTNINYNSQDTPDLDNFNFSFGAALGSEKRIDIGERIQFLHGPEVFPTFQLSSTKGSVNQTLQSFSGVLQLGYILGLQYNINKKFYLNLEIVPGVYLNYSQIEQDNGTNNNIERTQFGLGGSFNSESVALTAAYRFGVQPKK